MDIQSAIGSFVKVFDKKQVGNNTLQVTTNSIDVTSQQLGYLVNVAQVDGTSQIVQLTKEREDALGILQHDTSISETMNSYETTNLNFSTQPIDTTSPLINKKTLVNIGRNTIVDIYGDKYVNENTELMKPLGSSENPIEIIKDGEMLHSTQNLSRDYLEQIAQALKFEAVKAEKESACDVAPNIIYRVVYPEELDLKPIAAKPVKRGRPKKKPHLEEKPDLKIIEDTKPVKSARTRSGRITRPPQYIKKDFKKIDTSEVDNMETDLKITEFEPLKTNQPPTSTDLHVKVEQLENHQRKRSIAAQFRCPKCKKAYLGHSKMLKHLQKHPDHGPIPEHCKSRHNDTWNYLIDISNKNPLGQRGLKFCKELVTFLHNIRILAKTFFKHSTNMDENLYFVDSMLGSVLDIEPGNYVLNEGELNREIGVYSFIKSKCLNEKVQQKECTEENQDKSLTENITNDHDKLSMKPHNSLAIDSVMGSCKSSIQNIADALKISNSNRIVSVDQNSQCFISNTDSDNGFNCKLNDSENNKTSKLNCSIIDIHFATTDNLDNREYSLNCDMSTKRFDVELQKLNEQVESGFQENNINQNCKNTNSTVQIVEESGHIKPANSDLSLNSDLLSESSLLSTLPNLRTSVDELMLNNVDTTQVSNLLDNSTSSDEVMNVDQFVNERFTNLTESDIELPNTSLNLDLPSLELFQFHTS